MGRPIRNLHQCILYIPQGARENSSYTTQTTMLNDNRRLGNLFNFLELNVCRIFLTSNKTN